MLKVKFPFSERGKKAQEHPSRDSSSQQDVPSEAEQEESSVVTISDDDRLAPEVPGTSTSNNAGVPDRKRCLEDQASEASTP